MRIRTLAALTLALAPTIVACKSKKSDAPAGGTGSGTAAGTGTAQPPPPSGPTAAEAKAFIAEVDKGLREVWTVRDTADWERSTNITPETEARAATTAEAATAYLTKKIG